MFAQQLDVFSSSSFARSQFRQVRDALEEKKKTSMGGVVLFMSLKKGTNFSKALVLPSRTGTQEEFKGREKDVQEFLKRDTFVNQRLRALLTGDASFAGVKTIQDLADLKSECHDLRSKLCHSSEKEQQTQYAAHFSLKIVEPTSYVPAVKFKQSLTNDKATPLHWPTKIVLWKTFPANYSLERGFAFCLFLQQWHPLLTMHLSFDKTMYSSKPCLKAIRRAEVEIERLKQEEMESSRADVIEEEDDGDEDDDEDFLFQDEEVGEAGMLGLGGKRNISDGSDAEGGVMGGKKRKRSDAEGGATGKKSSRVDDGAQGGEEKKKPSKKKK